MGRARHRRQRRGRRVRGLDRQSSRPGAAEDHRAQGRRPDRAGSLQHFGASSPISNLRMRRSAPIPLPRATRSCATASARRLPMSRSKLGADAIDLALGPAACREVRSRADAARRQGHRRATRRSARSPMAAPPTCRARRPTAASDYQLIAGASFRMVLDVGNWDASRTINTPGQSGDPFSAPLPRPRAALGDRPIRAAALQPPRGRSRDRGSDHADAAVTARRLKTP